MQRFFLRAHDGDAVCMAIVAQPVQAFAEGRQPGDAIVGDVPVFIRLGFAAARAQFPAEEDVADAVSVQGLIQFALVELRVAPAGRRRTHVGQYFNAVPLQQADEILDGVTGMADGVENIRAYGNDCTEFRLLLWNETGHRPLATDERETFKPPGT